MSGLTYDAYGNLIPNSQRTYVQTALDGRQTYAENPNYDGASASVSAADPAPQFRPSWDNIVGTPVYRTIGHAVMPLRILWTSPVTLKDPEDFNSAVVTFAAAICAPIDESEEGIVTGFSIGANIVYTEEAGLTVPEGMNQFLANQMADAIANMLIYPGNETQLPDPTITSYEGAAATNAYRAMRYIVVKDWPLGVHLEDINLTWTRTNRLYPPGGVKPPPPVRIRPPRIRRPPTRHRKATGDYSCYIAYSDSPEWINLGADIFTPNGDIWAGTAGVDKDGRLVFVMLGDGPNTGMEGVPPG